MHIICILLTLYMLVLIASVVISWVAAVRPLPYSGPVRQVIDFIFAITNPVFRLVRGVLPPLPLGGLGIDLSPIIVFIVLGVVLGVICSGVRVMPRRKQEKTKGPEVQPATGESSRITPVEIQQKEFGLAFRGYNERD